MQDSSPELSQAPLHLLISEKLREQIVLGEFIPGGQLPSEHQLMDLFGVSRITVRRAIANLVNQGLVEAQRGKGVFVKEQRKLVYRLSNPMVFFEEDMARQGASNTIKNQQFSV
ncbi:MAG TPA: GntR family transcriptional regulator [Leptolyngbyaceae cyanobacterium M33_DOE_097]|uniref:GntR family transcriptional regulator n=1 Tax=Oscillatoriales cyanobacterium SpSt-418 TaxID=2282169 RepID=A0A7C3KFK6_9CYAN|nr:GntR family transcriptional regulator [Leptolyngbyaceae cyanobacterium M33_DOE_097]